MSISRGKPQTLDSGNRGKCSLETNLQDPWFSVATSLPYRQFEVYTEPGPYVGAAEEIRLAETMTALKGESTGQAVRTIICREVARGPKKDRWHPLFTTAEAEGA